MSRPPDQEPLSAALNPYAAPAAEAPASEDVPAADVTFEEFAAFVGPRHLYYFRAWRRTSSKNPLLGGFNWAAAFFNMFWLLYRKMYREFFIAFGCLLALSSLLGMLADAAALDAASFDRAVNVGFAMAMGTIGNGLYVRRARLAITDARVREPEPARRKELLSQQGGCNWLWPLVGLVVSVGVGALTVAAGG